MTLDEILTLVDAKFGPHVLKTDRTGPRRAFVDIDPEEIAAFTKYLFKEHGLRLNTITGLDTFEGFELIYHFSYDRSGISLSLRALLKDRANPRIGTITGITKSGWWIEREIHELLGINFEDNHDLRPLLLPDEWPRGVYPLRKDFTPPKRDSRGHNHRPVEG